MVGRGIVVNREVRIHRGERTDIHVDALSQGRHEGEFDITTVILEARVDSVLVLGADAYTPRAAVEGRDFLVGDCDERKTDGQWFPGRVG